ncbi:hypothetical protein GYA37_03050 [candidate division WWE3 bacterium]|uniref:Uncharacterized protein n=1 Tax=candidate division WWE3 bacterium TaxID=2053526 RepID=A0A7X9E7A3_UNCKA|nr:hypothetical protein [candidate division WWE3 bacterium]
MRKSSFLPLALIVCTFLMLPVAFWFFNSKTNEGIVRGVETKSNLNGVVVKISSRYGTWEMSKYLCKSKEECLFSVSSGKSLDKVGGGVVENQDIEISYDQAWKDYSFLKVFVKPAWGSQAGQFNASIIKNSSQMSIESVSVDNYEYNIVIIPLEDLKNHLEGVIRFSSF